MFHLLSYHPLNLQLALYSRTSKYSQAVSLVFILLNAALPCSQFALHLHVLLLMATAMIAVESNIKSWKIMVPCLVTLQTTSSSRPLTNMACALRNRLHYWKGEACLQDRYDPGRYLCILVDFVRYCKIQCNRLHDLVGESISSRPL